MQHPKSSKLFNTNQISADQLKEKIDQNFDLTLINVLSEETYVDCHISGSINIPFDRIVETMASWEKDKEIVVYCAQSTCNKSRQAYELLVDMGFTHAFEYAHGMKDWFKKKYPTTGTCTMKYLHE